MLEACPLPLGTVPVYQAAIEAIARGGRIAAMTADDLFGVIERHAADGVDFLTLHCGVTRAIVRYIEHSGRLTGIVSRGGAFLACWIRANDCENPLYEDFDRVLDIARRYDVTLSLGDGLRPGCLADATDRAQVEELVVLGELVERARAAGVQAMVEGPGHVPLDQVAANVMLQKQVCRGAPFYVLGPLVTDVAPGYDHITSAIGGALAGMAGADFICYVTPSEHLALPGPQDVRDGVIAARIAAHAADVVRLGARARAWDDEMARARRALDWPRQFELAIDPARARELHQRAGAVPAGTCTMCGDYCVFKLLTGAQ
jgi:phosphomethylpyrimidine synthase